MSEAEVISLIKEARDLCSTGKLRLHKFISNSEDVIKSLPREAWAVSVENLVLALGEPLVERAQGVQWCISSDEFQVRITATASNDKNGNPVHSSISLWSTRACGAIHLTRETNPATAVSRKSWMGQATLWSTPHTMGILALRSSKLVQGENSKMHLTCKRRWYSVWITPLFAIIKGYGQCSYLSTVTSEGKVHCALVMGMTHVVPVKVTTVPRLKLMAAAKTSVILRNELEISNLQEHYLTDS